MYPGASLIAFISPFKKGTKEEREIGREKRRKRGREEERRRNGEKERKGGRNEGN